MPGATLREAVSLRLPELENLATRFLCDDPSRPGDLPLSALSEANVCEGARIVYAAHYAGLVPAGPGSSHQSVRDISLLGGLPDVVMLQPCCAHEARMAVEYAVLRASETCVLRMNIGPAAEIALPPGYRLEPVAA